MRAAQTYPAVDPALLKAELERALHKKRHRHVLRNTVNVLVVVAAASVLISTLVMPVLHIYGSSMAPALNEGEIALAIKNSPVRRGDIIAFYFNNKILVKRLIGAPGDWIDISKDGTVIINGEPFEEPYLTERSFGSCDIDLPYQVPDERFFVMGDKRSSSMDSRQRSVGCIAKEQMIGKAVFRIWPPAEFGPVK